MIIRSRHDFLSPSPSTFHFPSHRTADMPLPTTAHFFFLLSVFFFSTFSSSSVYGCLIVKHQISK